MSIRKIVSLIVLNGILAFILIICYSPGYLNLRPDDISLFRAGMSILIVLFVIAAFIGGNLALLKEKTYKTAENISDTATANKILEQYTKSKLFGRTASSALNQLSRLGVIQKSLPGVVSECFEKGSMSHNKYMAIVEDACSSLFANIEVMAKHINLFDEKNYWYLTKHYKEDDIPDDIQEDQIRQYEKEVAFVKERLALNEKMLVKLGDLKNSFLAMQSNDKTRQQDDVAGDVARLTEELKYYEMQ